MAWKRPVEPTPQVDDTIAALAARAAERLGAKAIITFTMSGSTALRVAKFRPPVPIFAVTPSKGTRMKLSLSYGTITEQVAEVKDTDKMVASVIRAARKRGIVKKGDTVVITAGVPLWIVGKTNLLRVETV